ncbi:MAG: hypothetical protein K6A63_00680, partial [Acholeplasmatales bacterium]|nr:hypothetical protein [Acholeplasmatales bacterium]
ADYQKSLTDTTYSCKYLYYKTLRETYNLSPNEILYGVAIPQKKAFLLGDSSESKTAATYHYNQALKVSFANNLFIDIEDRIPNVRGGIAYLANCVVDNSRYFKYRTILQSKGAGAISSVNSKYKLALVSQGIIGGYGASICAENCLFIGVSTLVKNNSKEYNDITTAQLAAGYKLINCMYYTTAEADSYNKIINSDTDTTYVKPSGDITTANFNWHNDTNEKPSFDIKLYDVETLVDSLYSTCSVGTNPNFDSLYLTVNYQI